MDASARVLGASVLDEPDPMDGEDWFAMDAQARFKALMPRYARLTSELRDARDALEGEVQVRKGLEEALRQARQEARAAKASEDRIVSSLRSLRVQRLTPEMKGNLRITLSTPPMSENGGGMAATGRVAGVAVGAVGAVGAVEAVGADAGAPTPTTPSTLLGRGRSRARSLNRDRLTRTRTIRDGRARMTFRTTRTITRTVSAGRTAAIPAGWSARRCRWSWAAA